MKKIFLILLAFQAFCYSAKAQTDAPAITQLRELLTSAKTNFTAEIGAKIQDDAAGNTYYETKKPSDLAETAIVHTAA